MIFKVNGKYAFCGGRYGVSTAASLAFYVSSDRFPMSYYGPGSTASNVGRYIIRSKKPNIITINYGDGTIVSYPFVQSGSEWVWAITFDSQPHASVLEASRAPHHVYTDGFTGLRFVTFSFQDSTVIKSVYISFVRLYGAFPTDVDKLTELENLDLVWVRDPANNSITSFPVSIANNRKLKVLNLTYAGGGLGNKIPDEFFRIPLVEFRTENTLDLSDPNTSNLNKVAFWKDTLRLLFLGNSGVKALPEPFRELTLVQDFSLRNTSFLEVPPQVNSMVGLTTLRIGGALQSYGDFRACTNISLLQLQESPNLTTEIPAWFNQINKLSLFIVSSCFNTLARSDAFVNNLYAFIVANAAMTTAGGSGFRSVTVTYNPNTRPSGTLQQPAGFILGSNNGNPASPLEKIWVLVNQYKHVWSLPAA